MGRLTSILGIFALALTLAVLPALVEAKAGRSGGSSVGSRGSRTYESAPATPTAPAARPVERSVTPPPAANQAAPSTAPRQAAAPASAAPAQQPGFLQRNPFMAGLMGGLIGVGIGGLLFGGGLFGSGALGGAGILGLLLQGLLIGGLVWFVVSLFRRRAAQNGAAQGTQPAHAMAGGAPSYDETRYNEPVARQAYDIPGSGSHGAAAPVSQDNVGIGEADYQAFEQNLKEIQAAWSKADLDALSGLATPEIASHFSRELAMLASRGQQNHVEQVTLEQGDLAEAWHEDGADYATVAMRWTALDYTLNRTDGSVVDGSRSNRSESVEIWTFMRAGRDGKWLLSAIQQPEAMH